MLHDVSVYFGENMFSSLFGKKKTTPNSNSAWPFASPENEAVVTVSQIINSELPILLVVHNEEDGGWQFLTGTEISGEDRMLVGLKTITNIDPSILELADLQEGWQAIRENVDGSWVKEEIRF